MKSVSRVRLLVTPWTAAYWLLHPWDFPGKRTRVGCHCFYLGISSFALTFLAPKLVGFNSPSKEWPCTRCTGSVESELLDNQGRPLPSFLKDSFPRFGVLDWQCGLCFGLFPQRFGPAKQLPPGLCRFNENLSGRSCMLCLASLAAFKIPFVFVLWNFECDALVSVFLSVSNHVCRRSREVSSKSRGFRPLFDNLSAHFPLSPSETPTVHTLLP